MRLLGDEDLGGTSEVNQETQEEETRDEERGTQEAFISSVVIAE